MEKVLVCYRNHFPSLSFCAVVLCLLLSILCPSNYCKILDDRDLTEPNLISTSLPSIYNVLPVDEMKIEINFIRIFSNIRFRYARTKILAQITNHDEKSATTSFIVTIPKDQFVTEFEIERNGTHLRGSSEIIDIIKKVSNISIVTKIQPIGIVQLLDPSNSSTLQQTNQYKLTVCLKPLESLIVTFIYEGLIHKISGIHILLQYDLNIKSEQASAVKSFEATVNIMESNLSKPWFSNIRGKLNPSKLISPTHFSQKIGDGNWEITWKPNQTELFELIKEDTLGRAKIMYNIFTNSENNIVLVRDGYLAYLDDENLQIGSGSQLLGMVSQNSNKYLEMMLPRHVVFVLDVSGSMEGKRLEQLKKGMIRILNLMKSTSNYKNTPNFIDFVTFSNNITVWAPLGTTAAPHPLSSIFKNIAVDFIKNLQVGGSTNIYSALEEALRLGARARTYEIEPKSIIFLVSDGEPTSGLIDTLEIRRRVKELNIYGIPIFSLAFGSEADYNFCRNISSDTNGGLARKIFDLDTEDAAESFEIFYRQITSPSLQNVTFRYTTPTYFSNEVIDEKMVSVRYSQNQDSGSLENQKNEIHALTFDATTYEIPCAERCLMERLFALRKIKKMFQLTYNQTLTSDYCLKSYTERRRRTLGNIREANDIALTHNFVTPCTSLVIGAPRLRHRLNKEYSIRRQQ